LCSILNYYKDERYTDTGNEGEKCIAEEKKPKRIVVPSVWKAVGDGAEVDGATENRVGI